jgi:predicted Zn finger-like uncharacterized protein
MIASCPSCATRFEVADAKLAPSGRKVKCGKCGHVWLQRPDGSTAAVAAPAAPRPADSPAPAAVAAPAAAAPAPAASEPAASPEPEPAAATAIPARGARRSAPAAAAPRRRSGKQMVAMAAALLAVLGLLWLGVSAWRGGGTGRLPAIASWLFGAGAPREAAEGLGFENVTTQRRAEGSVQVLIVAGEVVNNAGVARSIPPLRGALLAADSREVQNWTFTASAERVEPGQRVRFETTLRSPAAEATEVKVTFALPGG